MIVTKRAIHRRTVLRGIGVSLALPLLDGMVPALTALAKTPAKRTPRFGAVYVPNGIVDMKTNWTPAAEGAGFEFKETLKSLEPFRDRILVLSGLNSKPPVTKVGDGGGVHARASTRFLTAVPPKSTQGSDLQAGTSMDQIAARYLGQETELASLELGMESTESAGSCDIGFSCAYTSTISWKTPTTPLPMENNPRAVFERLFGDGGTTDSAVRLSRMKSDQSILDSVRQRGRELERGLGAGDRAKLSQYFEAIRDVERRIQRAEAQGTPDLPVLGHPDGIPETFEEHAKLMYDLYLLAYQSDLTRVVTFMMGREFSGRTYPEIGVADAHHPISHHQGDRAKIAKLVKINSYHVRLFSYFLDKLRSTPDGDGSLLDQVMIVYGGGMSEGNGHDPTNLPILLVGGGAGALASGRHLRYSVDTPLANLHISLLDKLGAPIDNLGDSTGALDGISI